jgi:hypothetical protein
MMSRAAVVLEKAAMGASRHRKIRLALQSGRAFARI